MPVWSGEDPLMGCSLLVVSSDDKWEEVSLGSLIKAQIPFVRALPL